MTDNWGWVILAYTVTYTGMATFVAWTIHRIRTSRRRLEELQQ
jgi:hypothetical protein